jgi:hypothetical protein
MRIAALGFCFGAAFGFVFAFGFAVRAAAMRRSAEDPILRLSCFLPARAAGFAFFVF